MRQLVSYDARKPTAKAGSQRLVARLTPTEREVFEFVVQGQTNKQIAFKLGMAERTVKAHRRRGHGRDQSSVAAGS